MWMKRTDRQWPAALGRLSASPDWRINDEWLKILLLSYNHLVTLAHQTDHKYDIIVIFMVCSGPVRLASAFLTLYKGKTHNDPKPQKVQVEVIKVCRLQAEGEGLWSSYRLRPRVHVWFSEWIRIRTSWKPLTSSSCVFTSRDWHSCPVEKLYFNLSHSLSQSLNLNLNHQ